MGDSPIGCPFANLKQSVEQYLAPFLAGLNGFPQYSQITESSNFFLCLFNNLTESTKSYFLRRFRKLPRLIFKSFANFVILSKDGEFIFSSSSSFEYCSLDLVLGVDFVKLDGVIFLPQ